jgi:DNA-binding SARP family transcriptional activator
VSLFGLLGPVSVGSADRAVSPGTPMLRGFCAALMLYADQELPYHRLAALLWDAPPASATHNLRGYAMHLRRELATVLLCDRLVTCRGGGGGYRLMARNDELDNRVFEELAARGRAELGRGDPAGAAQTLGQALALWRGDAGEGLHASAALHSHFEVLNNARVAATEDHAEARLAAGDVAGLVPELAVLVTAHPLRERLWDLLIRAQYLCGDPASALASYSRARTGFADELGVDVSPELQRLHVALLRQDTETIRLPGRGYAPASTPPVLIAGRR